MAKKKKSIKSRLTVGKRNFLTVIFAICAILLFLPIATIAFYFIFDIFGQEDIILALFEKLNLRNLFDSFINKFDNPATRNFNQGYLFFSVASFIVLLCLSSKKSTLDGLFSALYIMITLVFIYYFALCALYPSHIPMKILFHWPYNISVEKAVKTLFSNIQFLACVTTILPFAISVVLSNINKDDANAKMAQEYEYYTEALNNSESNTKKSKIKILRLLPTYWGLFAIFLFQFIISIQFLDNEIMSFYLRSLLSLLSPLVNNSIFKMSALEAENAFQAKHAVAWKNLASRALDTAIMANENTEYYKQGMMDEEENSRFWLNEAYAWHSQVPGHNPTVECFSEDYPDWTFNA